MPSAHYTILSPVTALLVTVDNLQEAATFCGGTIFAPPTDTPSVTVDTPKGPWQAYPGSYIVQKGNKFGVVPSAIFDAIYQ